MSNARQQIFKAIRRNKKPLENSLSPAEATARFTANTIPASAQLAGEEMVLEFERRLLASSASVERVASEADIPLAVSRYLTASQSQLACFANGAAANYDWSVAADVEVRTAIEDVNCKVCITPAFRGIAETGSLVLLSQAGQSSASHFLPEQLIVVLSRSAVLATQEAVWVDLRQLPEGTPRTVNLVTGPSRTGDIEQKIILGAHGPKKVHVLLLG